MSPELHEWLNIIFRWLHVIAAIMWIGDSFLFMWLDSHLSTPEKPREGAVVGELWMVHSGGFYEVVKRKYLAPDELPKNLYWFKWESYTTWITGFFLLGIVYYGGGSLYLINSNASALSVGQALAISLGVLAGGWIVYDTLWRSPLGKSPKTLGVICYGLIVAIAYGLTHVFGGRAAFIHVGAMLGTIMAWNVFFRIIPAQKYMLAQTKAGQPVDTTLGLRAKQRSIHNHYMTLPVLFCMLSNHFPSTYGHPLNWLVLALLILFGAGIKYVMNFRGNTNRLVLTATGASLAGVVFLTATYGRQQAAAPSFANAAPVPFSKVEAIVQTRCITCHSAHPTNPAFPQAPNGIMFDQPENLHRLANRILVRAVVTKTMPLGNLTGMTEAERKTLGAWIAQGAHVDAAAPIVPKARPRVASAAPASDPDTMAKAIFETRCVLCHGKTGQGNGPASVALNPKPRNYTDHAWQLRTTDDRIRTVILEGGAKVGLSPAMPANADLANQRAVLDGLVRIVRGFDRK